MIFFHVYYALHLLSSLLSVLFWLLADFNLDTLQGFSLRLYLFAQSQECWKSHLIPDILLSRALEPKGIFLHVPCLDKVLLVFKAVKLLLIMQLNF